MFEHYLFLAALQNFIQRAAVSLRVSLTSEEIFDVDRLLDQIRFDRSSIFTNGGRYRDPSSETTNYFVGVDDTTVCSK